jgi:hypothetical protein
VAALDLSGAGLLEALGGTRMGLQLGHLSSLFDGVSGTPSEMHQYTGVSLGAERFDQYTLSGPSVPIHPLAG